MKPEQLVETLHKIYADDLISVVLYGSAAHDASQDHYSDFNVMIVLRQTSLAALAPAASLLQKWMKRGNPVPLVIHQVHLLTSCDVFPIEFLDMKERHRVLFGTDLLAGLEIKKDHLRLQCENEIKAKLIALRSYYLRVYPDKKKLKEFLLRSSSAFFAIFRGLLRLQGSAVPPLRPDILAQLQKSTGIEFTVFQKILEVRDGKRKLVKDEVITMLEEYLTTLEKVASFTDSL